MKTDLAARVLSAALQAHKWTQGELADKASLARSVVNWHLSRTRPIRDEHLIGYLAALPGIERAILLSAWMRDMLPTDIIHSIFTSESTNLIAEEPPTSHLKLRKEITEWVPELDEEQRGMLLWWAGKLVNDSELDEIFRGITRKAGYPN